MKNLTLLLAAALLLAGCGRKEKNAPRYDLALSKAQISMHYDQTDTLAVIL